MSRDHIHERVGKKYLRTILFITASIFLAALVWFGWIVATAFPGERTTIIASINPLEIRSWDEKRGILTVVSIPDDVRVDAAFGVGVLPVSSLAKLEVMDKTKKGILARSLTHALGTPMLDSQLPLLLRLRYIAILRTIRPDAVRRIDLASLGVYRSETLADGTTVRVFDVNRFDAVIGNRLEMDAIRREERRVRVVNTTDIAGLGNRAARMLNHAGMVVVAVENASPVQKECTIHVKQDLWKADSVQFIRNVFRCVVTAVDLDERADLTVRLGTAYASLFY